MNRPASHARRFVCALIVLAPVVLARAQTIRQVTDTRAGNSAFPRLDANGSTVVYPSSTDPLGTNADHAFQFFRAETATGVVTQVTSVRGGAALTASISDDGQRIGFSGPGNPTGRNHDGNVEIFAALRDGTQIRQLTDSTAGSSAGPVLCGNGSRVVFTSVADLTGGNADNSQEIFVIGWDGTGLRQLTSAAGDSGSPHISDDGTKVVFTSSQNLVGANADLTTEVYAIGADGTGLRQLTSSAGDSSAPWIAGNGTRVVFQSDGDPTGGNADLGSEIFVVNWDGTGLRQLTNSTSLLTAAASASPSVDDAGTNVVFHSNQSVFLTNIDGNEEIWKIRTDGLGLTALTSSALTVGSLFPAISGDGTRVAFLSLADLTTGNADGNPEVYTIKADRTALRQISSGVWGFNTALAFASGGSRIAFTSSGNPVGGNADRNIELFVVAPDGSGMAQLTSSTGLLSSAGAPSISATGGRIAFTSTASYTGANADAGNEIFAVNGDGAGLRQITADASKGSTSPALSSDGQWIAFVSEANPSDGNADGNAELFAVAWEGTGLVQLTASIAGASGGPSIAADGSRIGFDSTADLVPGGNVDGSREIFSILRSGTGLVQLTSSPAGVSGSASLRADGGRVVFQSTADLAPGGNADGNAEIFAVDVNGSGLTQLTNTIDGSNGSPVYSEDGATIAFVSSSPYGGPNPDGIGDVWRMAYDGSALTRLTGMHVGSASSPAPVADGSTVAFSGAGNITGANADQTPEVFLVELNRPWSVTVTDPNATRLAWDTVAGAYTYDVCRGSLASLAPSAGAVDLGPLVCVDQDSPEADTLGFEDAAIPGAGAGFFYLVRPTDGLHPPSYGQGTGARERQPGPGDCAP